jgi:hypothetical protein
MSSRLRSSTRASTVASDLLAEQQGGDARVAKESRSRTSASPKPLTKMEMAKLVKVATAAFLFSWLLIGAVMYFCLNDTLRLYPKSIKLDSLKGFNSRVEFSLRHQVLLYLWLFFNVHSVIYVRLTRKAINPLVESTEKLAQQQKNILTNSFEQTMMSSFLQLMFCSFADPSLVMKLIPAVNLVQFLGRIAFFLGYPYYRTFGVSLTLTPNMLMMGFNLYHFGSYLGFY